MGYNRFCSKGSDQVLECFWLSYSLYVGEIGISKNV